MPGFTKPWWIQAKWTAGRGIETSSISPRLVPGAVALGYKLTWWVQRPVWVGPRGSNESIIAPLLPTNWARRINQPRFVSTGGGKAIKVSSCPKTHSLPTAHPPGPPIPTPRHAQILFAPSVDSSREESLGLPRGTWSPIIFLCVWAQVGAAGFGPRECGAGRGVGGSTSCGGCARQPLRPENRLQA